MFILSDGSVKLWESIVLLLFYVLYVVFASVVHIIQMKRGHGHVVKRGGEEDADEEASKPLIATAEAEAAASESEAEETKQDSKSMLSPTYKNRSPSQRRGRSASIGPIPSITISTEPPAPPTPVKERNQQQAAAATTAGTPTESQLKTESTTSQELTPPVEVKKPSSLVYSKPKSRMDHEIREKQLRMMKHGLLKIVQEWQDDPLLIPTPATNAIRINESSESSSMLPDPSKSKKKSIVERWQEFVEWEDKGVMAKILHIMFLPFVLALYLTIPHADEDGWNKWLLACSTTLSPLVILVATETIDAMLGPIPVAVIVIACFIPVGVLLAIFAPKDPKRFHKVLQFIFIIYSFFVSMLWIYKTADELVNLLGALSLIFRLSSTVMGLTILAWGNSIGDFVADLTVARQGYPDMAIAATYAGPLFNMLIGIGVGAFARCIKVGGSFDFEITDVMIFGNAFLIVAMIISAILIALRKFVVGRLVGVWLVVQYLIFISLSLCLGLGAFHILPHSHHD